jgi:hypothetical protein
MRPEFQTIAALAIVAITMVLLMRPLFKKNKAGGCGGGCGCPSATIKTKLKQSSL